MPKAQSSAGFSMIEVLIALVILAVGILGVASLQGSSLRNTYSAHLRTQANTLAQDMVERLRANRDYALANNDNYRVSTDDAATGAAPDCTTDSCSAAQLAEFDRDQWLAAIETLPGGKGEVTIDPAQRAATIIVMWDNDRSEDLDALGTGCSGNPKIDLTCATLRVNP